MEHINPNEEIISTLLYRIPDDAKTEIIQALNMWSQFSMSTDRVLLEKALLALKNPYSNTTHQTTTNLVSSPVASNMGPSRQDQFDKVKNGISDFQFFLDEQINRANEETKTILNKTLESFNASIASKL